MQDMKFLISSHVSLTTQHNLWFERLRLVLFSEELPIYNVAELFDEFTVAAGGHLPGEGGDGERTIAGAGGDGVGAAVRCKVCVGG